jgi:hypothetical protein
MENNLFLIAVAAPLQNIANSICLEKIYCTIQTERGKEETFIGEYEPNWNDIKDNFYIIQYDQNKHYYTVYPLGADCIYSTDTEKNLFWYMDSKNLQFIGDDNPLGDIYHSYSMAILQYVRWAADIAWIKEKYEQLING